MTNGKIEKTDTSDVAAALDYQEKPGYTLKQVALKVGDIFIVVGITSGMLTALNHPIGSVMFNYIQEGKFLGGPWGYAAFRALYHGALPSAVAGAGRQGYFFATKQITAQSEMRSSEKEIKDTEKKGGLAQKLPGVALIAAGDVIVSQIPETIGKLAQSGISKEQYHWRSPANLLTLTKLGIVARYSRGMVNFTALCIATDFFAKRVPGNNEVIKQLSGGMISGLLGTGVSFPFGLYSDYLITKVKATEGKLVAPKASKVIVDVVEQALTMNSQEKQKLARAVAVQAGLRALRNGVTFAVIAGVSAALGSEPLTTLFNNQYTPAVNPTQKFKQKLDEIDPDKSQAPSSKTPNP